MLAIPTASSTTYILMGSTSINGISRLDTYQVFCLYDNINYSETSIMTV